MPTLACCLFFFNPRTPRGVRRRISVFLLRGFTISIPAPREGCDEVCRRPVCRRSISIHAPREGCDQTFMSLPLETREFQSTHPARGATMSTLVGSLLSLISIHAPREGCDASLFVISNRPPYFNPRTPRGVRRAGLRSGIQRRPFQSTHPARGATSPAPMGRPGDCNFNPRTPRGVRRAESIDDVWAVIISIHAPREGCDRAG